MVGRLISTIVLAGALAGQPAYAPHYAKGLMAKVARNRGIAPSACMVSSAQHPLGAWLYIYGERTRTLLLCKVVDVSAPEDRQRHLDTLRLVELAHENTRDLCGALNEPSRECPVIVWEAE